MTDAATAVGKWSRVATFGPKSKDGSRMEFTAATLGQMVDNAAARGDRIAVCADHASAFPEQRDAPALGFFYALAVVDSGRVVKHWAWDGGAAPDGAQLGDGLFARLGEVTPRGADPLVGLANYRTLSPMFSDSALDEQGRPIGYALFDVAATNIPFQSGAELRFHLFSEAPDLTPPKGAREEAQRGLDWRKEFGRGGTAVGVARARDIAGGRTLSEETVLRMVAYFARHEVDKQGAGWSPGEEGYPSAGRIAWALWGGDAGRAWAERTADRLETMSVNKYAASAATGGAMDPALLKRMGLADGASAQDKMAAYAKHAMAEGCKPEDLKAMAEDLDKHDEPEAKAMAKRMTAMGDLLIEHKGEPIEMAERVDPHTHEVRQTSNAENAAIHVNTGNVHDEAGRHSRMSALSAQLTAMSATNRAMASRLAELERAEAKRAAEAEAVRMSRVEEFLSGVKSAGYDEAALPALRAVAMSSLDQAQQIVAPLLSQNAQLFSRMASGAAARPSGGAADVSEKRINGMLVRRFGLSLSQAAKAVQKANPALNFEQAMDRAVAENPHLYDVARSNGLNG